MNAVKMLEDWVKRINPKAEILKSDSRCGKCYAVTYQGLLLTDFLLISELKQFLLGVFNAQSFLDNLNNKNL